MDAPKGGKCVPVYRPASKKIWFTLPICTIKALSKMGTQHYYECLSARRVELYKVIVKEGFTADVAEEAVQLAFITAWKYVEAERVWTIRNRTTWLVTVAVNAARRVCTKAERRSCRQNEHRGEIDLDSLLMRGRVSQPENEDGHKQANRLLAHLTNNQRDVYALWAIEGLGYEEISAELKLTAGQVAGRIRDARKRLREIIDSE